MKTAWKRLLLVALVAAALAALLVLEGVRQYFSPEYLHARFTEHRVQGALLFIALFVAGNLAHVPGLAFLAAAVLALGRTEGALLTYAAGVCACGVTFWVYRLVGSDALRALPGRHAAMVFHQLDTHPVRSVFLLRLFMQTLPTLSCALALSGVRFRHYMAGTILGLPLPVFLYALTLDSAASLFGIPGH